MTIRDDVVHISVRGSELAGTLVSPRRGMPGVLLIHGWGGSQQQYLARARALAALGCVCLTFDLSGHVATHALRNVVSRDDNLADVLAAYDFLLQHPRVDPARIAVVGSSYGGYLAALATTLRPIRWLALRAPALYRDSDWKAPKKDLAGLQHLGAFRQEIHEPSGNRALAACAAFGGDVLLVESELDTIVPAPVLASYRRAFVGASSLTSRVIRGADHALGTPRSRQAYASLLTEWLHEMMLGARGEMRGQVVDTASSQPDT